MLQVQWHKGLIDSIRAYGIEGERWGVETADRLSFFTLTELLRGCEIISDHHSVERDRACRWVEVRMREGHWRVGISTTIRQECVNYEAELVCKDVSLFQDFVLRLTFERSSVRYAKIADQVVRHEDTNVWHQYAVDQAWLYSDSGFAEVKVDTSATETAGRFQQVLYVRDQPGLWVVHARLIPIEPADVYWVRWINRLFCVSLNHQQSTWLLQNPWIKRNLWYLSERRGGRPQLQASGLARVDVGQRLRLRLTCRFGQRE
jgi:hypothetical protein